jgi:hypothetical protein
MTDCNIRIQDDNPHDSNTNPSEPSVPSVSDSRPGIAEDVVRPSTIYRLGHSDNFACKNCKVRGDKFFIEGHACRSSK